MLLGVLAAILAFDVLAGLALQRIAGPAGAALVAALGNGLVALRFGATLLPGREPLISRYSRFDSAGLPDPQGRYTRGLTTFWAALLGSFCLIDATAIAAAHPIAVLSAIEALVCVMVFCGEHAVRNRRFPQLGRATPLRTVRAICLAHGVHLRAA